MATRRTKAAKTPPNDLAALDKVDLPFEVKQLLADHAKGKKAPAKIDQWLRGPQWKGVRNDLVETGLATFRDEKGREQLLMADFDAKGHVVAMAAAIPRQPGRAYDFLNQVEQFRDLLTGTTQGRKDAVALFHKLYRAFGPANNAVNKLAALVAPNGQYKVRSVKGQRGKSGDKAAEEFQTGVNWWKDRVNARPLDAVITGDKGVTSFIVQGTRLLFIEGDHIARHVWPKKAVQVPSIGKALKLPMNLQSFSVQHTEIPEGLEGTNYELIYWVPPSTFINQLRSPRDPNLKKKLDQMLGSDVKSALLKDGKYLLDESFMMHIKHRGTGVDTYGQSLLEPAMSDIRYFQALDALELTIITNLMARMVIIKVGSDNPESEYHTSAVTASRLTMLQRMMRLVGPAATVLWGGPDINVVEVSAHNALPAIEERYKIAERRLLMSLGLPAVLMVGEGGDGKAAGFAASLGVAAELREIQDQYKNALEALAQHIADENGYEEVEVVWEWTENLLEDKETAANLILKLFQSGLLSPETALEETGFDYAAEQKRQADAVTKGYKEKAFGPPLAMVTDNPTGDGGETGGRPTKKQNPKKDPRAGKETKTPEENS
jgi:hypothetical protein